MKCRSTCCEISRIRGRNRRDHLSDSRVRVLLFSPGTCFSVSFSDTASLSARISHRDSANDTRFCSQRECCRLNCNETFSRLLSLLRATHPSHPSGLLGLLPRHFPSSDLEDLARSFVDLFSSRWFLEISRRLARFILFIVERGRPHLRKNFEETSAEKVPSAFTLIDWYDFIDPPRFIDYRFIWLICTDSRIYWRYTLMRWFVFILARYNCQRNLFVKAKAEY